MSKYILKLARCIQELERIKGVRQGSFGKVRTTKCPSKTPQITQEDIAKQFGVSVKKVQRIKDVRQCSSNERVIIELVSDKMSLTKIHK